MRDIDAIIAALKERHPCLRVKQLQVKFPGDDDGIWYFWHDGTEFDVSLESSYGTFPFVVESTNHGEQALVANFADAIRVVESWLGLT